MSFFLLKGHRRCKHKPCSHEDFNSLPVAYFIESKIIGTMVDHTHFIATLPYKDATERNLEI